MPPFADCLKVRQHRDRLAALRLRYAFDDAAADKAVRFIERNIRQWKDPFAGKPFILTPWQRDDVVRPLFGFKRCPVGASPEEIAAAPRLFREAYLQIPRKNGKTTLAAAILLYLLFVDAEGAEIYTAATKRDQAKIAFGDCKAFIRKSPALRKRARVLETHIEIPSTGSTLRPLSADVNSLDGLNVSAALIDELHAHQTRHIHDVIVTATGSRSQPLVLKTTTAGEGEHGVCKDQYEYAEKILAGVIEDDAFFCYITEADKGLDWKEPAAFRQANPNFGISISEEYLANQLRKATNSPAYRKAFERYHLNRWMQSGSDKWLPVERWKANKRDYTADSLAGQVCFGGMDLASNRDLTAFALVFPAGDSVRVLNWYWVPEETMRDRVETDRVPYDLWAEDGWLRTTPGNVADYEMIGDEILEICRRYNVKRVAYDNWNAVQLSQRLAKDGLEMVEFIQGLKSFHTPSMEFERLVLGGMLEHNGNPVTTWCASNVRVLRDPSGKIRPVRGSEKERIDGIIASIMALDGKLRHEEPVPHTFTIPGGLRALLGA